MAIDVKVLLQSALPPGPQGPQGPQGSTGALSNGTSNVSIPELNGNVTASVGGNANVFIVTATGANVTGTFNATGNITQAGAGLATTGKAIAMTIVFGG